MEVARREMMINGRNFTRRLSYGRSIPRRGQVKVAIVLGLAHTLASLFSCTLRTHPNSRTQLSSEID
ncbi:hypothetical protein CsSME_00032111 [Camellia sinensis var. sinensis]